MRSGTKPRLLIVEDDGRLRRAFASALARDYDVVATRSVDDAALVLANDADVEVVLCDLVLDGAPGDDLFTRLEKRRDPRARRLVLMTAHDPSEMQALPVPMLRQPVHLAVLREALAGVLAAS